MTTRAFLQRPAANWGWKGTFDWTDYKSNVELSSAKSSSSKNNNMLSMLKSKNSFGGVGMPMEENAFANFGTDKAVDLSTAYGGGESGGTEAGGTLGYIAAVIGLQQMFSQNTDREIDGVQTSGVFNQEDGTWRPHFTTEPWYAYLSDQFGWEPTSGEKFDASFEKWMEGGGGPLPKEMGENLVPTIQYWGDPVGSWLSDAARNVFGDTFADIFFPDRWLGQKISDLF